MLVRIVAPYFAAGAVFEWRNGKYVCVEAAPIIGWMKKNRISYEAMRNYCRKKKFTVEQIVEKES